MFVSPTYGELSWDEMHERIISYITFYPDDAYKIIIGTDSTSHTETGIVYVTAVVVHHIGHGGIYFWKQYLKKRNIVLQERMYTEATLSLETAEKLVGIMQTDGITKYDIEIHVDIGTVGKTKELISGITGMIAASGYPVKFKPDSFAASKIADRYT